MKDLDNKVDIDNWASLVMRKMHKPIKEGLFMDGGLTPHQYLSKQTKALLEATCLEVIGEDEDSSVYAGRLPGFERQTWARNILRATQRSKLKDIIGGK